MSSSKSPRPRGRPPGRTAADGVIADRNTLLETAEALIRKEGTGISLQAIAAAAGVTKPTLYREVGDKDALVQALSERFSERMSAALSELIGKAKSPREGLRNLVSAFLNLAAEERDLYLFITAGTSGDDRLQRTLLLADGAASQFSEPIAAYRSSRGENPDVADVWSYGLLGALHFVTLWWLRDQTLENDVVVDQITALLWSGMSLESGA